VWYAKGQVFVDYLGKLLSVLASANQVLLCMQAMDRAHRLGQTRTVNVYRLLMAGTLEEKVMSLQQFKMDMANTVSGRVWRMTGARCPTQNEIGKLHGIIQSLHHNWKRGYLGPNCAKRPFQQKAHRVPHLA